MCHSCSWIFFPSTAPLVFFFFLFFISSWAPISGYLLAPADLGSSNGRAGKADEVMDG